MDAGVSIQGGGGAFKLPAVDGDGDSREEESTIKSFHQVASFQNKSAFRTVQSMNVEESVVAFRW